MKKLDTTTEELLKAFATSESIAISEMTPEQARNTSAQISALSGAPPEVEEVKDDEIVGNDDVFNIRYIKPFGEVKSVIVYYHGGGWVIGDIDTYDTFAKMFAIETSSIVVMVNYRKAPEFKFPAAVNDSYAALEYVSNNFLTVDGKKLPLVVAGDSAGGNLCAVVAQKAKKLNGPQIKTQILIYPVTDADFETDSYRDPAKQLLLTKSSMMWFWNHYVPNLEDRQNPEASPLQENDLYGLPPTILITAGYDPLLDDGSAYAGKLIKAGVTVLYKNFEDQTHNFFVMPKALPESEVAIRFIAKSMNFILENN